MLTFFKINKYVRKLIFLTLILFSSIILLFLYKPSFFTSNIEQYIVKSLTDTLTEVDVSIEKINGNFFSNNISIDNFKIVDNNGLVLSVDSIYIEPNILDIVYGEFVFSSLVINDLKIMDIKKINFNNTPSDSFIKKIFPKIVIKNLSINQGHINYGDNYISFSAVIEAIINKNSWFNIKDFNINHKGNNFSVESGTVSLTRKNILLNHLIIKDNKKMDIDIYLDIDFPQFKINKTDITINLIELPFDENIKLSNLHLLSKIDKKQLLYTLTADLGIDDKIKNLIIRGDYKDDLISFNVDNINLFDNFYNTTGFYSLDNMNGKVNVQSNNKNSFYLNGDLLYSLNKIVNIDLSLVNTSYYDFKFDKISGNLVYDNQKIHSSNIVLTSLDNIVYNINDFEFNAIDDYSFSGKASSKKTNFEFFYKLLDLKPTNIKAEDVSFSYNYIQKKKYNNLLIEGFAKSLTGNNFLLLNTHYNISSYNNKYSFGIQSNDLVFNNYSFDLVKMKYHNKVLQFNINNSISGEFFDLSSRFMDTSIAIDYLKGRINNIDIGSEKITINNTNNEYRFSNMKLSINTGNILIDMRYKNLKDYSLQCLIENLNFEDIDNLILFNNRYSGFINGEFYLSRINSSPFIITNLFINDGRIDDVLFEDVKFQASLKDNLISVNNFNAKNTDSSISATGFIEINDMNNFKLSPNDIVKIDGKINNFNIAALNQYIPWMFDVGGYLNSLISINGSLKNIEFSMNPLIFNPKFDKIVGNEIAGKINYKNNRLYFDKVKGITQFGHYDMNGSLPANFDYYTDKNINSNLIDININANSTSLELLTPYFSSIKHLSGNFEYYLNIHGNYRRPIRDGEVVIRDSRMNILQIDNPINNINAHATINNNRLMINSFTAELSQDLNNSTILSDLTSSVLSAINKNKGNNTEKLHLSGSINLESFFDPDLSIHVNGNKNYISSSYGQFEGFSSADISITGRDTILISGYISPESSQFTIFDIENRKYNNKNDMITGTNFIAYDVYIPFFNGIRIKSDNLNLFLEGEVNLSSFSNENISFSGKANIIDGSFFYNGNEFYNTQGTILMNPSINSPYIELHSNTDIYDDNISVSFIGYLDNPNLILESNVSDYSQNDILQLLTFKDKNINTDQSIAKPFSNILSNYLESQLEKNITLYTDLDEFRVQHRGSLIKGFSDADINVLVGKRISNRIYLNTRINLNDNNPNEYEMSYKLNKNTSIVAKINDNKYWQLNYRFKYRY